MLLISPGDNIPLPNQYHAINNVCAHIYDQLTDLLTNKTYHPYFNRTPFEFELTDEMAKAGFENGEINILDWLKNQGMETELHTVLVKHITLSILSDFVNFVYESLKTAQKGKITVAYALLRKPFTDELLLLEQLLAVPHDFIERFFHIGDIKLYDPSSRKNPPNEREIIKEVLKKIALLGISADQIYRIRYDKSYAAGINGISNQALHIVTNDSNYRTSNQNLNFVFSGPDDQQRYWQHYYQFLPLLLIYSAAIVDEILLPFLPDGEREVKETMRTIKRLLAIDKVVFSNADDGIAAMLSGILESECNKCGKTSSIDHADFNLFFETEMFLCPHCFNKLQLTPESIMGFRHIYQLLKGVKD